MKNATIENKEVKEVNVSTDSKNLEAILKKYENINVKNANGSKASLFKNNDHLNDMDGGKAFRKKQRNVVLRALCLSVLTAKSNEQKQIAKANFLDHYKKVYAVNDLSLSSIYRGSLQREIIFYNDFFAALNAIK